MTASLISAAVRGPTSQVWFSTTAQPLSTQARKLPTHVVDLTILSGHALLDLPLDLAVQALQELILLADHLQHLVELLVCLLCFIASTDLLVSLVECATIWILAGLLRVRWIRLMRSICIVHLIGLVWSGLILLGVGGVSILEAI